MAPVISIYGGKITTYRRLARDVVNALATIFPTLSASITHKTPLPGAFFHQMNFAKYYHYAKKTYFWLDQLILQRMLETYGSQTEIVLQNCHNLCDLGQHFGHGLFQREVDYLCQEEWAISVDDILCRRTKLGLKFLPEEKKYLLEYLSKVDSKNVTH
jgi:glycerol-3-phosphate dehydrogenase